MKFNIDKYKVLHIGSKNIQVEYKINQQGNQKSKWGMQFGGCIWWDI